MTMDQSHDLDETPLDILDRTDSTDSIDPVVDTVRQQARAAGLTIFPTAPEIADYLSFVDVATDQMSLEEFLAIGAELGCRLLYVATTRFYLGDLAEDDVEDDSALAAVRRAAARFNGKITQFDVVFPYNGVLHRWSTTAPFQEPLEFAIEQVTRAHATPRSTTYAAQEAKTLSDENHERLVEALLADREFRASGTRHSRHRAARQQPELAALLDAGYAGGGAAAWRVVHDACERADHNQRDQERALQARLPELAALLRDYEDYKAAHSSTMRKQIAADFLREHNDGYPVKPAIRDELIALARDSARQQTTSLF